MIRVDSAERIGATVKKINSPKPHRPNVKNTITPKMRQTGETAINQVNRQAIET